MTAGPEFFQTIMGKRFYEGDVPRAIRALERIADALEKTASIQQAAVQKQEAAINQDLVEHCFFVMREECAFAAEDLWGEEAAVEIRNVPFPGSTEA
jgi:hypothetical protein